MVIKNNDYKISEDGKLEELDCENIPEGVKIIPDYFDCKYNLCNEVVLPKSIKEISSSFYTYIDEFKKIIINSKVKLYDKFKKVSKKSVQFPYDYFQNRCKVSIYDEVIFSDFKFVDQDFIKTMSESTLLYSPNFNVNNNLTSLTNCHFFIGSIYYGIKEKQYKDFYYFYLKHKC